MQINMKLIVVLSMMCALFQWSDARSIRGRPPDTKFDSKRVILTPTKNPDELSGFTEGDIVLPTKAASVNSFSKWTDGVVPFVISSEYGLENDRMIRIALSNIENSTCIRFVNRTTEQDYISFQPVSGCSSTIGRQGGKQMISLTDNCFFLGVIIHEVMHTLGFWHEHNRIDRDNFVRIQLENVLPGYEKDFEKYSADNVTTLDLPYDYGSIMHGSTNILAKNGTKTIVPIPDETVKIGQRIELSPLDLEKLNKYYDCPASTTTKVDETTVAAETIPATRIPDLSQFCKNVDGYDLVPNPYNCSQFFVCWNGMTELRYCPDGLFFNPELDVCDWPSNVPCQLIAEFS